MLGTICCFTGNRDLLKIEFKWPHCSRIGNYHPVFLVDRNYFQAWVIGIIKQDLCQPDAVRV